MKVIRRTFGGWMWYFGEEEPIFDKHKCGKWMYFFYDKSFIESICIKAIKEEIVLECKHTNDEKGVSCFYIECDDIEAHKKVINFFLSNNLIPKTKQGRYYNISFKLDDQTRAGEYGDDYIASIKLEDFIDLGTGEWKLLYLYE